MNKKAIKVDLSLFFGDERKMSYIFVDPNWKTVECLQRRVEHLFDINSVWFLSDGCYLPSKEPIEIIKYCDVIKAFVLQESQEPRKKKKSKKLKEIFEKSKNDEHFSEENGETENGNDELVTSTRGLTVTSSISLKTYKLLDESNQEHQLSSSKHSGKPKKRKHDNNNSSEECKNVQQLSSSINSINHYKKRKSVGDEILMTMTNLPKISSSNILNGQNSLEESKNKPELSSHKTSSSSIESQKSVNEEIMSTTCVSKIASSTLLNENSNFLVESNNNTQQLSNSKNPKNPFKKCKSINKGHIYFDETGDILSPKSKKDKNSSLPKPAKKSGTIVIFHCPLNDVEYSDGAEPQKPRIFNLKSKNATAKQLIEIQEDILIPSDSTENDTNKSGSSNEATIVNNVEKDAIETDTFSRQEISFNSTMAETENEKQISSENLNNESKTDKTNINEAEIESLAIKDVTETSNGNKTELSCIDEPVSEAQNGNPSELSARIDGNSSETQNESQTDRTSIDKNLTHTQLELTDVEDQTSEVKDGAAANQSYVNENSVMSVDCVDLSADLEDEVPLKDDSKVQHDLTAEDDESDKSSASDVEEVSEIIDLNESEYNCNTTFNNSKQNISLKKIKVDKILPLSTDITDLPSPDDIIVFKIPYTINKTYACTNFIAGKVEYVNKRTKNIKVLIIDGISELRHVPTHFLCNLDDSLNSVTKHLQIKLADVLQPKLFSMS